MSNTGALRLSDRPKTGVVCLNPARAQMFSRVFLCLLFCVEYAMTDPPSKESYQISRRIYKFSSWC